MNYLEKLDKHVTAYDNGGETLDRYTLVIDKNVYTMSHNPDFPTGVCTYDGTIDEIEVDNNQRIPLKSLPLDVQKKAVQLLFKENRSFQKTAFHGINYGNKDSLSLFLSKTSFPNNL